MTRTWGLGHWVGWPCQASSSSSEGAKQAAAAGVSRHSEEGPTAEMELLPLPPCATAAPPSLPLLLAFPSSPTALFRRGASLTSPPGCVSPR